MPEFTFYLGAHRPHWLESAGVPLFVSRSTLGERKTFPRAIAPWAMDSGAFFELQDHGRWRCTAREYVDLVRRCRDEIGMMQWAAPMDWPCEEKALKRTGLTVEQHQQRTLDNFLELSSIAPEVPWVPVLQGWQVVNYWEHADAYERAGVRLASRPLVGVGSVCRRQSTKRVSALLASLQGLKLHGFGFKKLGLRDSWQHLESADSLAWSYNARRNPHGFGCDHDVCNNCLPFALAWRSEFLAPIERAMRTERRAA